MSYFPEVRTGQDIAHFVTRHSTSSRTLATVDDQQPLVAVKIGGDRKPAIVIKAGTHASEIGGVHAALTLIDEGLDTSHEVYVIPCGSPFDFGGFNRALSFASGKPVDIKDDSECLAVLSKLGRKFHQGEHFALFRVGEIIFTYVDQEKFDPRTLHYRQFAKMSVADPKLREEFGGRRIFCPNSLYYKEDYTCYDHAGLVNWVQWDGWVSSFNSFFDRINAPLEVRCVRELCESIKPALALDLHESCINARIPKEYLAGRSGSPKDLGSHFLILPPVHPPTYDAVETTVANALLNGATKAGFKFLSKEALVAAWGYPDTDYYEGYIRCHSREGGNFYQWMTQYDASIVVETRLDQPVEMRARQQCAMVRAAVKEFERLMRERS